MKVKFCPLAFKLSIWITAELFLGSVGLDQLADYSEYLTDKNAYQLVQSDRYKFAF